LKLVIVHHEVIQVVRLLSFILIQVIIVFHDIRFIAQLLAVVFVRGFFFLLGLGVVGFGIFTQIPRLLLNFLVAEFFFFIVVFILASISGLLHCLFLAAGRLPLLT
jgi:hypothetical protein